MCEGSGRIMHAAPFEEDLNQNKHFVGIYGAGTIGVGLVEDSLGLLFYCWRDAINLVQRTVRPNVHDDIIT